MENNYKKHLLISILLFTIFVIPYSYLMEFFCPSITAHSNNIIEVKSDGSLISVAIFVVLIGPFFETFIAQLLPIEIINNVLKTKYKKTISILISSILFGIAHYYNTCYILFAFFMGVVFALIYTKTEDRFDKVYAFFTVFIVHALNNLMTLMTIL